jgi:sugar (pentulose or hexulose) kinase
VFPVAADGAPLGRCLMTSDMRGDEVAAVTAARRSPEEWFRLTGHVPRRMDPVNRALWWRSTDPQLVAKARWFMNWHEFYALRLSGRPVVDWTDAGTWATYDVATGNWSSERIAETGIDPGWLPEVQPNASPIGPILPRVAADFGLPDGTLVVTGAYDTYAAAVGSGAVDPGVVSLACGTWHSYNTPVRPGWPVELVRDGMNVFPHPGPTGFGILVTNPNGMSVVDWARGALGLSIPDLEAGLAVAGPGPGHVFADARFTPLPHMAATPGFGGTFAGVTLAAIPVDIVRALLEAIACEFSLSLDLLRRHGIDTQLIRATGGGSKNAWWLQLMADLCGIPIEVVAQEEPGAFGAAILAGVGAGVYESVSSAVAALVNVSRRFEPDAERGAAYAGVRERLTAAAPGSA